MKSKILTALLACMMLATACNQREVTRIDPNTQTDLSGKWNDTDSKLVSKEMIADVLARPWRTKFEEKYKKKPVIIIGLVKNKTHEHIDPETFIKDMEKEFINTGMVRVVQAGEHRKQLREERDDQQTFASEETRKKWGKELGADFMMQGTMNSHVDPGNKEKVVAYKINLELVDLETNEKVWIGDKEIKKHIKN
jgi:uncharacterized protein (TIGR02722 family)